MPHEELAQLVLEESGYIDMWKAERTPDAAGRLDNLKELVRSMGEFPDLGAFLEHVSLVMDVESAEGGERVSIMTLHAAKGLEFDIVFLPGWEEGLFPNQRSLDDNGRAGLEEERRLAYVGLTRARRTAKIYHAANRRVRGLWQILSAVAVHRRTAARPRRGRGDGGRRRVRRLRRLALRRSRLRLALRDAGLTACGGLDAGRGRVAWLRQRARRAQSTGRPIATSAAGGFAPGARVFHLKFGPGSVVAVGRPEAHHRFRPCGPQDGDGQLRDAGAVTAQRRNAGSRPTTPPFLGDSNARSCWESAGLGLQAVASSPSRAART